MVHRPDDTPAATPIPPSWTPATRTIAVIAGLDLILFGWYLHASIIRTPYWDMYSWVLHYLDHRAGADGWWAYLWASHDLHRPVLIRLLTAFDIEAFGGVSYPFIAVATAMHALTAMVLFRECRTGTRGPLGLGLGCLVLMLVLTSVAAVDCALPLVGGNVHVLLTVVLAIVLFDGSDDGGTAAAVGWRRAGSVLAAVAAPFASAVGWAVWPILAWTCWRGHAGRRWLVAVVATGLALAALYFRGLSIPVGAGTAAGEAIDSVGQVVSRIDYLLTFLGLPLTRAAALLPVGRLVGAALLVAGLWAVASRGVVRRPADRRQRLAVALIMFSLASAVLATLGRAGVTGPDDVLVPVRYSVLLTPLHVGLLWIAVPTVERLLAAGRFTRALELAMVLGSLALVVQQIAGGHAGAARTAVMRAAIERFEAGGSDADIAAVVYVDLDQARREREVMRQAGVYQRTR